MRVLIVEDDMVVAGCLKPVVVEAGHQVVGLAADRDSAIALLGAARVHLALIDLGLADGQTGLEVARAAADRGVAALLTTSRRAQVPDDFAGALGVIAKPYAPADIAAALAFVAGGSQAAESAPRGLELSPCWAAAPRAGQPPRSASVRSSSAPSQ
ncbi:response regulator [Hansschlegelia sp.]|uniref:response regulator n=1 Tax=Hansschlegelia sp. TaxID=2041892 RepID=UPI002C90334B|nr:response regulator [Hansschlegelia sp.]HVI27804.1 response regulator [Hansschlegelia sp.]